MSKPNSQPKPYRHSTIVRAQAMLRLTELHYEPGNQRRNLKAVWRRYVWPEFGCSYRTYIASLRIARQNSHHND